MKRNAFSLLELSIVIAIIGLMAAAVTVGQKVMRQSSVKALIEDINQYQSAMQTFKLGYQALPGDFSTATSYWTSATNGDGDNQLEWNYDGTEAFIHLTLAEVTSDNLSHYAYNATTNPATKVAINIPQTRLDNVGIGTMYCSSSTCSPTTFLDKGNYFTIGKNSTSYNLGGAVTGLENYNIDKKMDDGIPGSGIVRTIHSSCVAGEGSTPWDSSSVTYDKSYTTEGCYFYVRLITEY